MLATVCAHAHTYARTHTRVCVSMHAGIHAHYMHVTEPYARAHTRMNASILTHSHTKPSTNTHTHTHIHIHRPICKIKRS